MKFKQHEFIPFIEWATKTKIGALKAFNVVIGLNGNED